MNKRKLYYLVGKVCILSGECLLLFILIINAADYIRNRNSLKQFDELLVLQQAEQNKEIASTAALQKRASTEKQKDNQDEDAPIMAKLSIGKIELTEAVKEGTDQNALRSALGHMEDTAFPGEIGNCVIAGHRNYMFGRYFNRLDEMETGDEIVITTETGTYTYTVFETQVVLPEDISVLEQTKDSRLTLITCTPLFVGSHRLIIKAALNSW